MFSMLQQFYIGDPNLVITALADVLAPEGARTSAGTGLTTGIGVSLANKHSEYIFTDQILFKLAHKI